MMMSNDAVEKRGGHLLSRSSQVRLVIGIPVLTTFFVLTLGLAVMQICQRMLFNINDVPEFLVQRSISDIVLAVLVVSLLALLAGSMLAIYLTRPMRALAEKADHIARGDLAGGTPGSAALRAAPEFTELGNALDRLVESMNRTLVNGVNCGVILVDGNGDVTFANQNAVELLGIVYEGVVGRRIEEGPLAEGDLFPLASAARETLRNRTPVSGREIVVRSASGSETRLRISTSLYREPGVKSVGVSVWIEDVTSISILKRNLNHIERILTSAAFVEGIAHQVRNPLCSIRGHAQLIKEKGSPGNSDLPDGIINNVDIIDNIIRNFLEAPGRDLVAGVEIESAVRELRSSLLPDSRGRLGA